MNKNIVFDIGNVLIKYKPMEFLCQRHASKETVDSLYQWVYRGPEWIELDRGTILISEAAKSICVKSGLPEEWVTDALCNWVAFSEEISRTTHLIPELKHKGYHLYFLSNFHCAASRYAFEKFEFFRHFDGGVFSCDVKLLKPELAIYRTLAEKYRLNAAETVFVDDMPENIAAAQELGWKGICFGEDTELLTELEK